MGRIAIGSGNQFGWQFFEHIDSGRRAHGHARAAIDTLDRVNEKRRGALKVRLIFFRMDAINRAGVDT